MIAETWVVFSTVILIEWKLIHKQLFNKIKSSNYQHYISIEMSKQDKDTVKKVLDEFVKMFKV